MQPMAPELPVWNEPVKFRLHDVDFSGRATCASLCWHFLEAAWNHAEALGVGNIALGREGRFWVLSRLRIEVKRFPAWSETGTIRTWPRAATPLFAMRDFELLDGTGSVQTAGSSAWLVLDAASKRPQRIAKILSHLKNLSTRTALGRDPEKLPDCNTWESQSTATVQYSDLDINGHMNSSQYVGTILDAYPIEFHRAHSVRALEINYLDEALAGETLTVHTHQSGPSESCHSMARETGAEVCRARIEWLPD